MEKILIVEDNYVNRGALVELVRSIKNDIKVYAVSTVAEAYRVSMENIINLFLVDIILDMNIRGDVSGLKFVQNIRKLPQYSFTPLIFITSLEDPQLYAYRELHCFGYIEKPFDKADVQERVKQALKYPQPKDDNKSILFRKEGVIYPIKIKDIIYIEIRRRQVIIYTTKDKLTVSYMTSEKIMEELSCTDFVQCSRYTIVNKNYIRSIDYVNRFIKLDGVKDAIEIGASMKKRVKDELGN